MNLQGEPWQIEFYADESAACPVLEFIGSLPVSEQAAIKRTLQLLQEFGLQLPATYVKALSGHPKLWEIKVGGNRLFYFAHTGRTFVVLHGFRKKSSRTPPTEIAIAERRMREFNARVKRDS